MPKTIHFYNQNISYTLKNKKKIREWINACAAAENKTIGEISYLFGDDSYVLEANRQFLNHDYLTDILTFDYSEHPVLQGDIAISIDRVRENAKLFGVSMEKELLRVIIHGILHLCGYKDKTKSEMAEMRKKEDECLQLFYNNTL